MNEPLIRRNDLKDRIFEAALTHAAFDGWTLRTLRNAASDLGLSEDDAIRLFPSGASSLLNHLDPWLDQKLRETTADRAFAHNSLRHRIIELVLWRLEPLEPHRETFRRALAAKILPDNAYGSLTATLKAANTIEGLADPDQGATRLFRDPAGRIALSVLIAMTTFFWLQDNSPKAHATKRFLERRLDALMRNAKRVAMLRSYLRLPQRRDSGVARSTRSIASGI